MTNCLEDIGRYWKGNLSPEQINKQVTYVVETIENNKFVYVGQVTFSMKECYDAMDATRNIADNMPSKFAKGYAEEKFPELDTLSLIHI